MILENEPVVNKFISVPKEMSQLNCAAFTAGIIEAILDGAMFVSDYRSLCCLLFAKNYRRVV